MSSIAEVRRREPLAPNGTDGPTDPGAQLAAALLAYLDSGGNDRAAEERALALPGGREALEKAVRLKKCVGQFDGNVPSVEQFLTWKHEETLEEQREAGHRLKGEA